MVRIITFILQLLLILIGPALFVCSCYGAWAEGYRTENWSLHKYRGMAATGLFLFWLVYMAWLVAYLSWVIYQDRQFRRSKSFLLACATVSFVVMLIGLLSGWGGGWFERGRMAMEAEIDLRQLAIDCVQLHRQWGKEPFTTLYGDEITQAAILSPTIHRLRPVAVTISAQQVMLALHIGHEHYGYRLDMQPNAGDWTLFWYLEGLDEKRLSLPDRR